MHLEIEIESNAICEEISLQIKHNDQSVLDLRATGTVETLTLDIDEQEKDHTLVLIMQGKKPKHTLVDADGMIIKDIYFLIRRLEFNGLNMMPVYCQGRPCYTHNFNSGAPGFVDEFYGTIGCNGEVKMEFSTPIYLWMYHNLDPE